MESIEDISDIDTETKEGRYLMAALAKLTTEIHTNKTPEQVLLDCGKLVNEMGFEEPKVICLTLAEIQSSLSRVQLAEGLIAQLPKNHEGRNSWLMNYGHTEEATEHRANWSDVNGGRELHYDKKTDSYLTD